MNLEDMYYLFHKEEREFSFLQQMSEDSAFYRLMKGANFMISAPDYESGGKFA